MSIAVSFGLIEVGCSGVELRLDRRHRRNRFYIVSVPSFNTLFTGNFGARKGLFGMNHSNVAKLYSMLVDS